MFGKIKDMFSLEKWVENFEGYLDSRIELLKFDIKEGAIRFSSKVVIYLAFVLFALATFALLNLGLAALLNHLMDSSFWGFFILAAFYFVIALIFFFLRNSSQVQGRIELKIRESSTKNSTENEPNP